MHAKRKDENYEFENRFNEVGLLQTDSPQAGNLRLARWVEKARRKVHGFTETETLCCCEGCLGKVLI
jgi:hypothetical protein